MFDRHPFVFIFVAFALSEVLFVRLNFAMPSKDRAWKDKKKELNKCYYETNKDTVLLDRKEKYVKEDRTKCHHEDYYTDVMASRTRSAE